MVFSWISPLLCLQDTYVKMIHTSPLSAHLSMDKTVALIRDSYSLLILTSYIIYATRIIYDTMYFVSVQTALSVLCLYITTNQQWTRICFAYHKYTHIIIQLILMYPGNAVPGRHVIEPLFAKTYVFVETNLI